MDSDYFEQRIRPGTDKKDYSPYWRIEFEDESLDLDLVGGVSSEMLFKVIANTPLIVFFESREVEADINDLFNYNFV